MYFSYKKIDNPSDETGSSEGLICYCAKDVILKQNCLINTQPRLRLQLVFAYKLYYTLCHHRVGYL